ncbi:HNH endonuclease [Mumia sp. ZJ1417]|nr:HNH endonuclease [Mumia sp. ZJ1417]
MSPGVGLIAHACATSDAVPVSRGDRLPWPDHRVKPYHFKFSMRLLQETTSPTVKRWAEIQRAAGSRALANIGFLTIDTQTGVEDLAVTFTGGHKGVIGPPSTEELDIPDGADTREWQTAVIAQRRGQRSFRNALLVAYGRTCAVTRTSVEPVLEAAHISPWRGDHSNDVRNGLLLRADIHTLFDLHRLTVVPDLRIRVDPTLGGEYARLNDNPLRAPEPHARPAHDMLRRHNERCDWLR